MGQASPAVRTVDTEALQLKKVAMARMALLGSELLQPSRPFSQPKTPFASIAGKAIDFVRRHPVATFAGTLLAASLYSPLAVAGPLTALVGSASAIGWSGLAGGSAALLAMLGLRHIYTQNIRPGASSMGRLFTRFFLPLTGGLTLAGTALYGLSMLTSGVSFSIAGLSFMLTGNTPYYLLAAAGFAVTGIEWLISAVRGTKNLMTPWVRESRGDYSTWERIKTEFYGRGAKAMLALYYGYRHTLTGGLMLGIACKAITVLASGAINPAFILIGAGAGLLHSFLITKPARDEFTGQDYPGRPGFTAGAIAIRALIGAATGALAGAAGVQTLVNGAISFLFLAAEDHAFLHSWRLQDSALEVEATPPVSHSDQLIDRVARDRLSHFINMIKVSGSPRNVFVSLVMGILVRKGANWSVSQIDQNGYGDAAMRQALDKVRELGCQLTDEIVLTQYKIAKKGSTVEALEALARAYDTLGDEYINKHSHGNFASLDVKDCTDRMFERNSDETDCELTALGKIIRTEGHIFKEKAEHYRTLARKLTARGLVEEIPGQRGNFRFRGDVTREQVKATGNEALLQLFDAGNTPAAKRFAAFRQVVAVVDERVMRRRVLNIFDCFYRKFHPHLMFLPIFDWKNICPYISIQKEEAVDAFYYATRNWGSAISILTRRTDGKMHRELIPLRVIKELDPAYQDQERWAIESAPNMDNRYRCRVKERFEMESLDHFSPIAFICNLRHYLRHGDDHNYYPTADITKAPRLDKKQKEKKKEGPEPIKKAMV